MNTYGITVLNGDKTQAVGNSPKEAFESIFPGVELIPCDASMANICIQLLDGARQSNNFYRAAEPAISKQNLEAYHINNRIVIKFLNVYPDRININSDFENRNHFQDYEKSSIGASYKIWGKLCKLIKEKEMAAKEKGMHINKYQLYDRCASMILTTNKDTARKFAQFAKEELANK